jgi:hypothetical protein
MTARKMSEDTIEKRRNVYKEFAAFIDEEYMEEDAEGAEEQRQRIIARLKENLANKLESDLEIMEHEYSEEHGKAMPRKEVKAIKAEIEERMRVASVTYERLSLHDVYETLALQESE